MFPTIDLVIRAVSVLCAAWIIAAVLRRSAASVRALVWTAALGGILLLPAVSQVAPSWPVMVWQSPQPTVEDRTEPARAAAPFTAESPSAASAALEPKMPAPLTAASVVPAAPAAETGTPLDWSQVALVLWGSIAAALLARIARSHFRMRRLLADTEPADARWRDLVDQVRSARGIRRGVIVRISHAISVPAVVGVLRPALLLPPDAAEWDGETRRAVVLHELAHVARWDGFAQLVGHISCAVYWFIPLSWYGARRAAALRERASDDEVLRAGMRASSYAARLLNLAQGAGTADMRMAAVAMAWPSRMRERLVAILDPAARRNAVSRPVAIVVLLLAAGVITAIAAVAPSRTPKDAAAPVASAEPLGTAGELIAAPVPGDIKPSLVPETEAADQNQPRLCGGSVDSSSQSINDTGRRRSWTVKLSGPGCQVDMQAEGRIDFNDDFTDIRSLGPGGVFRLDVTDAGVRRQLDIETNNGSLMRRWRVNGQEQPYDAAAHAWLAGFLIELDRRTGVGADVRLPHLRQSGIDAVLRETAEMSGDHARNAYYTRLAKTPSLRPGEMTRVLDQAARLTKSDHEAYELLRALAEQNSIDPEQRAAMHTMIQGMESDHYRLQAIELLLHDGRPSAADVDFIVGMIPRMRDDHYKSQTLTRLLERATLTPAQQASLARTAAGLQNEHYSSEFLRRLAGMGQMSEDVRQAFLTAVGRMDNDHYAAEMLRTFILSQRPLPAGDVDGVLRLTPGLTDHYRAETLKLLLEMSDLSERSLLGVVESAAPMTDHYEAEMLRKVLRHGRVTARVREAALAAAERLSPHYRDEIRSVARAR